MCPRIQPRCCLLESKIFQEKARCNLQESNVSQNPAKVLFVGVQDLLGNRQGVICRSPMCPMIQPRCCLLESNIFQETGKVKSAGVQCVLGSSQGVVCWSPRRSRKQPKCRFLEFKVSQEFKVSIDEQHSGLGFRDTMDHEMSAKLICEQAKVICCSFDFNKC